MVFATVRPFSCDMSRNMFVAKMHGVRGAPQHARTRGGAHAGMPPRGNTDLWPNLQPPAGRHTRQAQLSFVYARCLSWLHPGVAARIFQTTRRGRRRRHVERQTGKERRGHQAHAAQGSRSARRRQQLSRALCAEPREGVVTDGAAECELSHGGTCADMRWTGHRTSRLYFIVR